MIKCAIDAFYEKYSMAQSYHDFMNIHIKLYGNSKVMNLKANVAFEFLKQQHFNAHIPQLKTFLISCVNEFNNDYFELLVSQANGSFVAVIEPFLNVAIRDGKILKK